MRTKLVILDWAGTAVDYGCFAPVNAFARAFQSVGLEPTVDEIRAPMGLLKRDHIRTMLNMDRLREQWMQIHKSMPDDTAVEEIYQVFEESLMKSLEDYAVPKPGTIETVKELHEMGIHIGSTTGYTDKMMDVVTRKAAELGYIPDAWFSPDAVGGLGRPYPYMIYENMRYFQTASVQEVIKVGDTVSDIREGKQAGVLSLGVLEGSSVLGLSQAEYEAMPESVKKDLLKDAGQKLLEAGADDVLLTLRELPDWIRKHEI